MIQLIPQLRILIACQPIDFRNGIDGLAALCKHQLSEDPFSGTLFVFRNRRGSALKLLCYDGFGYWLITPAASPKGVFAGGLIILARNIFPSSLNNSRFFSTTDLQRWPPSPQAALDSRSSR